VTSLTIERLSSPSNIRGARAQEALRQRAADVLAAHTVWCAAALTDGRTRAGALRTALDRGGWLELEARGPQALPGEDQIALVAAGDIVVLHDRLTAQLAEPIRERGAHAVLNVGTPIEGGAAVHAYLMTWRQDGPRGMRVERIAAVIPAVGVVAAKEPAGDRASRSLGWTALLADVLRSDRGQTVGGTFHARPAVAAR
jgi:hypothetical protein